MRNCKRFWGRESFVRTSPDWICLRCFDMRTNVRNWEFQNLGKTINKSTSIIKEPPIDIYFLTFLAGNRVNFSFKFKLVVLY